MKYYIKQMVLNRTPEIEIGSEEFEALRTARRTSEDKAHPLRAAYESERASHYDECFEYRFMEALRNYVQHRGMVGDNYPDRRVASRRNVTRRIVVVPAPSFPLQ